MMINPYNHDSVAKNILILLQDVSHIDSYFFNPTPFLKLHSFIFIIPLCLCIYWLYRELKAKTLSESALQKSEARLLAILSAEPECVILLDELGRVLQINEAGLKMLKSFQCSAGIIGQPIEALIALESRAMFKQLLEKVANGQTETLIFRLISTKNQPCWVETSAVPLLDIDSNSTCILAVMRDITQLKRIAQREHSRSMVLELLTSDVSLELILETLMRSLQEENPEILASIILINPQKALSVAQYSPKLANFYRQIVQLNKNALHTLFINQRLIIQDFAADAQWANYQSIVTQENLAGCWSEPIIDSTGRWLGVFVIYLPAVTSPNEEDLQLLQQTAALCAIAIEKSQLNDAQKIARTVYENSSEAMTVTDADGIILTVNSAFTELTGYALDEVVGQSTRILSSGKQDSAFYQAMWQSLNRSGTWQGEILNRRKNGEIYTEWLSIHSLYHADGSVDKRVALFSDITHRKESEHLIWKQANFDLLTHLPNRQMFQDRLEQEIKKSCREHLQLALLVIDLDRFKEINETIGHEMGDKLLKEAAHRLSFCVREADTVARLGGDEFAIILSELHGINSIDVITQNILQLFVQPFLLSSDTVYISASIGIALYPDDATEVGELLKSADQAMYAAKNQGRNRYSYFAPFMQEAAKIRMRIATDLRNALNENQFKLLYQPIVELNTGAVHKAEALIRWQHPIHHLISPVSFIPIAEETDMILKIGNWVFKEAVMQVKQWRAEYDIQFQISINKSPIQFQATQSTHHEWIGFLKKMAVLGNALVIEITEGLLMETSSKIINQLKFFQEAGFQVSLDDFGTGYSSLSYLKKFNIDYLKIDQSFVRNMNAGSDDLALCEAIIVMAHKLGIKVIAEGIETLEQRDLLMQAGCDYGQGYFFSHPISPVEFENLFFKARL